METPMNDTQLQDIKGNLAAASANVANINNVMDHLMMLAYVRGAPEGTQEYRGGFEDGKQVMIEEATDEGLFDDLLDLRIALTRLQNIVEDLQRPAVQISDDQLPLFVGCDDDNQ